MINDFSGKYAFLSNFYHSPIEEDGITYPTVEHYFQAMKTTNIKERQAIAGAPTPGKAKRMGRRTNLRPDWEDVKIEVMRRALGLKFADPKLANMLIATEKHTLIEGTSWHDNFWGICYCDKCLTTDFPYESNHLGLLLMELRQKLKEN